MHKPNCLVFPDRKDWIVFAPISELALRVDARGAERFRLFVDRGRPGHCNAVADSSNPVGEFKPTRVAIYANNQCSQKCVYCYGFPSRRNKAQLDLDFCRAAFEFVAQEAARQDAVCDVYFTGTGEPTYNWPLFTNCVQLIEDTKRSHAIQIRLTLGTGGQVNTAQADWIARHFDGVNISLDGPADIQNQQRPRRDRSDSLAGPLQLAKAVRRHERKLQIKCVVTRASVKRMTEIVEFVGHEIGPAELEFEMMFDLPWISPARARQPDVQDFIEQFGCALDAGSRLKVTVRHQVVHLSKLARDPQARTQDYLCLAPPNIITAFHDMPQELDLNPQLGAYGWYDKATSQIHFDHEKRRQLYQVEEMTKCRECPCRLMCCGYGAVKSRLMSNPAALEPICEMRIGILQQLLRRAVPRQTKTEEHLV